MCRRNGGIDGEGQQLTEDDHELVKSDDAATHPLRRGLRQIDRHRCRGRANGKAEHHPEGVHHPDAGSHGRAESTNDEQDSEGQQVMTASPAIAHHAADEPAEGRTKGERPSDGTFLAHRQSQTTSTMWQVHEG